MENIYRNNVLLSRGKPILTRLSTKKTSKNLNANLLNDYTKTAKHSFETNKINKRTKFLNSFILSRNRWNKCNNISIYSPVYCSIVGDSFEINFVASFTIARKCTGSNRKSDWFIGIRYNWRATISLNGNRTKVVNLCAGNVSQCRFEANLLFAVSKNRFVSRFTRRRFSISSDDNDRIHSTIVHLKVE